MSRRLAALRRAASVLMLAGVCLAAAQQKEASKPAGGDPERIDLRAFQELREHLRGKPLLVNFWATWCEPCREEYPMVNELAKHYAPQGLAVIGISLDDDSEINLVRRFLQKNRPVFANYRKIPGNEEAFIKAVNPKWSGAIPANFFYGRDGRGVKSLVGEYTREEFEKAITAIVEPPSKDAAAARTEPRRATR